MVSRSSADSVGTLPAEVPAPRFVIQGLGYDNLSFDDALGLATREMQGTRKSELFFLNIDCLRLATRDPAYARILSRAALVLPDGVGLRLATRVFGGTVRADTNGSDFTPQLLRRAAAAGVPVFLLGSVEGVAARAAERLCRDIPTLRIVGVHSGFFQDDLAVVERINRSGAGLLLVGMGVPRQERWIASHREILAPQLCVGVGALFNWLSGAQRRAPAWAHWMHLEWAWRIVLEPRRMFTRYILRDLPFLVGLAGRRALRATGAGEGRSAD